MVLLQEFQMYRVYVFNYSSADLPYKNVRTCDDMELAIKVGCKLIHTLVKEFREDLYVFMEEKELTFDGELHKGVHIYNGNISWCVFVTNAHLAEPLIGPMGYDKDVFPNVADEN